MAPLGSHGATCRNPAGRNANGTVPPDTALPANTSTSAASPVPGRPVTAWQPVTNATNVSAPRNPTPSRAQGDAGQGAEDGVQDQDAGGGRPAARTRRRRLSRHQTRSRRPRKYRPMLASTEGMSRPSSNTNTDRPARSPAGSGATSREAGLAVERGRGGRERLRDRLLLAQSRRARRHDRHGTGRASDRAAGRRLREDSCRSRRARTVRPRRRSRLAPHARAR